MSLAKKDFETTINRLQVNQGRRSNSKLGWKYVQTDEYMDRTYTLQKSIWTTYTSTPKQNHRSRDINYDFEFSFLFHINTSRRKYYLESGSKVEPYTTFTFALHFFFFFFFFFLSFFFLFPSFKMPTMKRVECKSVKENCNEKWSKNVIKAEKTYMEKKN